LGNTILHAEERGVVKTASDIDAKIGGINRAWKIEGFSEDVDKLWGRQSKLDRKFK
jgi:hypothetical protein